MMRTIHLHGRLKKKFGTSHRLDVATAGEALRALHCGFPNFASEMRQGSYRIIRGRRNGGMDIALEHINDFKVGSADLHIVPVAEGAKSSSTTGTVKVIVGVALVGAAIFLSGGTLAAPLAGLSATIPGTAILGSAGLSYGSLALLGLGIALSGASTLMAKPAAKPIDSASSFAFSGPINVNAQGYAIPVIYGEVICGSQPISAGIDIENIGSGSSGVTLKAAIQAAFHGGVH